jgi:hypothetical protein
MCCWCLYTRRIVFRSRKVLPNKWRYVFGLKGVNKAKSAETRVQNEVSNRCCIWILLYPFLPFLGWCSRLFLIRCLLILIKTNDRLLLFTNFSFFSWIPLPTIRTLVVFPFRCVQSLFLTSRRELCCFLRFELTWLSVGGKKAARETILAILTLFTGCNWSNSTVSPLGSKWLCVFVYVSYGLELFVAYFALGFLLWLGTWLVLCHWWSFAFELSAD